MIDVYVRHYDRVDGILLGKFGPEHLKPLIEQFKAYPTLFLDTDKDPVHGEVTGQFINGSSQGCYFEIIVSDE